MKVVIMAGGYAKRMWPLTENQPKSLLPIAGKPMIDHILQKLSGIPRDGKIIISTNSKFGDVFSAWARKRPDGYEVVTEPTRREEEKFGTVGAMNWLIKEKHLDDDLLIIGGDNLFEMDLKDFLSFQRQKGGPSVALHDLKDPERVRKKLGVCVLNQEGRIVGFQEKPESPKSTLAATCIYYFPRPVLKHFQEYLSDNNNPDAPGFFVQWLSRKMPVFGFVFSEPWYDIGSFEVYEEVNRIYKK
jgi:glucose-1-phosphate thymidylyltransferase